MTELAKKDVLLNAVPNSVSTNIEKPTEGIVKPNENSGALFSAGTGLLSTALPSGFNDQQRAAIGQAGQTIGNILQDRFFKSQAADWEQNDLAQFKQASSAFYNSLGTIEDEDQMAQAATDWQMNTFDSFMTKTSLKYSKNPYIMGTINEAKERWLNGFDQFMGFQDKAWQKNLQSAKEEDLTATTDLKKAQAEEARAGALLRKKQASDVGKDKTDDPYKDWPFPPNTWADPNLQRIYARQMGAKNPDLANTWDKNTIAAAVESEITRRKLARQTRDDGQFWGQNPTKNEITGTESDSVVMEKELRSRPAEFQNLLEAGRISQGISPGILQMHGGYYDQYLKYLQGSSILTPEEQLEQKRNQLRGNIATKDILGVITTLGPKEFEDVESVDDFIKNKLPSINDPVELGPSIAEVFENAVVEDEYGQLITRQPAKNQEGTILLNNRGEAKRLIIENYPQLVAALAHDFKVRIVGTMVSQDPGSKGTRQQVEQLANALATKFAPQIAQRLDPSGKQIKIPKKPETVQFKGVLPWLQETLNSGNETVTTLLGDKENSQIGILPR